MENRRNFIKKAITGLAFVGIFLKDSFVKAMEPETLEEQNLQKQFGKDSMCLDGQETLHFDPIIDYVNLDGMWSHVVVLASSDKTHLYIDGKLIKTVAKEYNLELANNLIAEYFSNANSIPKSS